jgi:hypothetical protein
MAFMHAATTNSQDAFARNCALGMAAGLFAMTVHRHGERAKLTC